ncbi:hypothetical protein [Blastococcus capsensis]|nr:hypothetical protein [Blastococcus capsensis]MDK3257514.1 hypothetical protein [Blastococcus capsensis]
MRNFVLALSAAGYEEILVMDEKSSDFLLLDGDEGRVAAEVSVTSYSIRE